MANTPIQFVNDDPAAVLQDVINDIQSISGRTLGNADGEMLLANAFAYRGALYLKQLNYTGNQNLISFASGAALEELGLKNGTFRLPASFAVCTIEFTLAGGAPTLTIPAGTRIKSQDGAVLFATNAITNVPTGTGTIDVDCTCLTAGVIGNDYAPGYINVIVDPVAFVTSGVNTDTSTGGADEETDDQLRVRIPLANATYSVAGPEDAYIYFAKSASPSIVDVSITSDLVAGAIQTSSQVVSISGGYAIGDTFTVNGGTTLAFGQVLTVDGSGVVLTYKILKKGSGYVTGTNYNTTAVTGGGTGFEINVILAIPLMTITLYPLLAGGVTPNQAMLDAVEAICSDKKVRPLSDTVVAAAPTAVDYTLTVYLILKKSAAPGIETQVLNNLQGFVNQWDNALGVDVIVNQIIGQCMLTGVYQVFIPTLTIDISINDTQFANCTGISVSIQGIIDEP